MINKVTFLVYIFIISVQTIYASDTIQLSDSINTSNSSTTSFRSQELLLPISLLTIGIGGYYMDGYNGMNNHINNGINSWRGKGYIHVDDYLQYLPAATYISLGFLKGTARLPFRERLAVSLTAYLTMAALTNVGKYTFKEKRPDSSARNSFPSGHTATVFTGAELMRTEYGTWPGLASYSVAIAVAFLRLYNGRHWLNDVLAGAGIGIFSARVGYWMLPMYRKWFGWGKKDSAKVIAILPEYLSDSKNIGLSMIVTF